MYSLGGNTVVLSSSHGCPIVRAIISKIINAVFRADIMIFLTGLEDLIRNQFLWNSQYARNSGFKLIVSKAVVSLRTGRFEETDEHFCSRKEENAISPATILGPRKGTSSKFSTWNSVQPPSSQNFGYLGKKNYVRWGPRIAHKSLTPGHLAGRLGSPKGHQPNRFMFMYLFSDSSVSGFHSSKHCKFRFLVSWKRPACSCF